MTYREMRDKYPDIKWEKSYNTAYVLGYKEGDEKYKYQITGNNMIIGDYTPEPNVEINSNAIRPNINSQLDSK